MESGVFLCSAKPWKRVQLVDSCRVSGSGAGSGEGRASMGEESLAEEELREDFGAASGFGAASSKFNGEASSSSDSSTASSPFFYALVFVSRSGVHSVQSPSRKHTKSARIPREY